MARQRYRYIATLIIGYFTHGIIVQMSDKTREFSAAVQSSQRYSEATILQSMETDRSGGATVAKSFESPLGDQTSERIIQARVGSSTANHGHDRGMQQSSKEYRPVSLDSLRYAAFGTSRTWGSGLDDPATQAYIKLLSPNGVNFGLRATAADYPSICLHSMIGDSQIFDVIILEFTAAGGLYHKDFARLAKRARARFPKAVIIYLPIFWILHEVRYKDESIFKHLGSRAIKSQSEPAFEQFINSLPDADLKHNARKEFHQLDLYRATLADIDGHMIEFPAYEGGDLRKFIIENSKYIGNPTFPLDDNHPSILGHQRIAELIKQLLRKLPLPSPTNSATGEWLGGKDSCVSWFSSGRAAARDVDLEVTNMKMNPIAHESKWAWEVAPQGGTITVNCRDPPCDVFIGHMASTHIENYPRARLKMRNETTVVSPLVFADNPINMNVISRIGTLYIAGKSIVSISPLPDRAANPFRITGVLLSPVVLS